MKKKKRTWSWVLDSSICVQWRTLWRTIAKLTCRVLGTNPSTYGGEILWRTIAKLTRRVLGTNMSTLERDLELGAGLLHLRAEEVPLFFQPVYLFSVEGLGRYKPRRNIAKLTLWVYSPQGLEFTILVDSQCQKVPLFPQPICLLRVFLT